MQDLNEFYETMTLALDNQMKKDGIKVEVKRSDTVVVPRFDGIFTRDYIN